METFSHRNVLPDRLASTLARQNFAEYFLLYIKGGFRKNTFVLLDYFHQRHDTPSKPALKLWMSLRLEHNI